MKTFNDVVRLPEFEKDLKKLLKRFKTLEDDLDIFIRTELNLYHKLRCRGSSEIVSEEGSGERFCGALRVTHRSVRNSITSTSASIIAMVVATGYLPGGA